MKWVIANYQRWCHMCISAHSLCARHSLRFWVSVQMCMMPHEKHYKCIYHLVLLEVHVHEGHKLVRSFRGIPFSYKGT